MHARVTAMQGAPEHSFWFRKTPENPPPNPPLVRGGAWRSLTLGDGKCPPRHKCSTENLGFHVLRIWFRKKWGFESPFPNNVDIAVLAQYWIDEKSRNPDGWAQWRSLRRARKGVEVRSCDEE
jgi:hypothetical protein